jgi:hypothetical protein
MENLSEVARLRKQIDDEYAAAELALYGPAMVGGHDFITTHTANMCELIMQLGALVGNESMAQLINEL